jgi:hypothetical protein
MVGGWWLVVGKECFCQSPTTNHQPPIYKKRLFVTDHSFLERDLCEQP